MSSTILRTGLRGGFCRDFRGVRHAFACPRAVQMAAPLRSRQSPGQKTGWANNVDWKRKHRARQKTCQEVLVTFVSASSWLVPARWYIFNSALLAVRARRTRHACGHRSYRARHRSLARSPFQRMNRHCPRSLPPVAQVRWPVNLCSTKPRRDQIPICGYSPRCIPFFLELLTLTHSFR